VQLQSGQRLGPYEIVEGIGAGGMGEVYRARDTRLSRNVAIKVLHGALRDDPRLRARFEREAKAISSLNDPHICALHDIGSHDGVDYLVLEYCDGITLSQRLDRGPLTIAHVLQYGNEIAAALSRAHRAGIVHRDLKPANIMLTKSGVKLLDFGLAKPAFITTSADGSGTTSLHEPITQEGSFLGTIQYMVPEVLSGKEADARTDIFALGIVLYEMLTGKHAFSGTSAPSIMAAILEHEPQGVRELRPQTPPALDHVISRSLAKNPDERWESAHDVAEQLRWISESPDAPSSSPKNRWIVPFASAAAALLVLAVPAVRWTRRIPETDRVTRLSIPLETSEGVLSDRQNLTLTGIDLSRDGSKVAYSYCAPCDSHATNSRVYLRQLDSFESVPVPGTEGGTMPFFSPDGQWIGFFVMGQLRRIPITGGTPQIISSQSFWVARGMSWAPDDTIYFAPGLGHGLWSVAATGGKARPITVPDAARRENAHLWPQVLPDGEHVLFTVRTAQITSFDQAQLAVLSLKTGTWKVILEGGTFGRYSSGQLLFARTGALYAVPFDLASTSVTGAPRKVLDGVATGTFSGVGGYQVSDGGDLIYMRGAPSRGRSEILAVDRTGASRVVTTLPVSASRPALSPDGRKVALTIATANREVWLYDLESAVATRLGSQPGDNLGGVWTPDGKRLIYTSNNRIVSQRVDGSAEVDVLLRPAPGHPITPWMTSCSPDGRGILYSDNDPVNRSDIWILPLEGDRTPRPVLRSPAAEYAAHFSPDGKWIAYVATDVDHPEVYVRPTTGTGQFEVSHGGGNPPSWSRDGKEIFYLRGEEMIAVPIAIEGSQLRPGKPRVLFRSPSTDFFDVTKDGFLMVRQLDVPQPREINVVLNWKRELVH
jgi:eukaryotic-like serine/threonine-protein kinase